MSRRHPGSRHYAALDRRRWAAARRACFERDRHRCTNCGVAGRLEAHHRTPLDEDPGQDPYDVNGLLALCRSCHVAIHRRQPSPEEAAWRDLVAEMVG